MSNNKFTVIGNHESGYGVLEDGILVYEIDSDTPEWVALEIADIYNANPDMSWNQCYAELEKRGIHWINESSMWWRSP